MGESKSPFDRLIELCVGLIVAIAFIQFVVVLVVGAIVRAWNATFGQPVVGVGFTILFFLIILAFIGGLLVRVTRALGSFWRQVLEQFAGHRAERRGRVRGAEPLDPPSRQRKVDQDEDPALPIEAGDL